jgi:benzodiazapine receptor
MAASADVREGLSRPVAALIVAGVLGASAVLGRRNAPDPSHPKTRRWYKRLDKPAYTPPDAVFGAVWPVLETGLAVGGYRLMRAPGSSVQKTAVGLWLLNTAMVGGWTELFFRKRALETSAVVAGAMVVTGGAYVAAATKVDRPAAVLGVPFVAWLGFATLLAARINARNPSE